MADKADKRKRACITVGYGPDGRPVKKWVAGKNKGGAGAEKERNFERISFRHRYAKAYIRNVCNAMV